jgi:transcriptional regulator with XRE-family HTH domain
MRFQFLKPRRDVATAEQVRALRERRGWTAEQLADEVHASALEVSAWEAGAVRVPPKQALLIGWQTERAAWSEALHAALEQTCPWVRENAPDLYEQMFRRPAGSWYGKDARVREHLDGCARCTDVWKQAERIGGFPAKPDTSGSLRARYRHWVDRLPDWAQWPFTLAGLAVTAGFAFPMVFAAMWAPDQWVSMLLAYVVFIATLRVSTRRMAAAFLPELAGISAGLLSWSLFPGNDLSNPRPWAAAAAFMVVAVLGRFWDPKARKRKARTLAAGRTPVPALSPPPPDLAATLQRVTRPSSTA